MDTMVLVQIQNMVNSIDEWINKIVLATQLLLSRCTVKYIDAATCTTSKVIHYGME